jgi:hypothetical protein
MTMNMLTAAATLTDNALLSRLQLLARRGREITVELVAHLAELENRKVLPAEAHSLFSFCREVLFLSEHAAYNRIEAARAARKFPAILDRLADGSLNLSTVRLLAPHLTADNHVTLMAEAAGKSKRDVEILVARVAPRPDVPALVRKLPAAPATAAEPEAAAAEAAAWNSPRGELPSPPPPAPRAGSRSPGTVAFRPPRHAGSGGARRPPASAGSALPRDPQGGSGPDRGDGAVPAPPGHREEEVCGHRPAWPEAKDQAPLALHPSARREGGPAPGR